MYLKNPDKVTDTLRFCIFPDDDRYVYGHGIFCRLEAEGYGTSIMCEPYLYPELDFGTVLTHNKIEHIVKFTNMGKRGHRLLWSRNKQLKRFKESSEYQIPYRLVFNSSQPARLVVYVSRSVFKIAPATSELHSGEYLTAVLEGVSNTPVYVEEDFYCYAVIEGSRDKSIILSFIVTAMFVDPVVEISKPAMHFCRLEGPHDSVSILTGMNPMI